VSKFLYYLGRDTGIQYVKGGEGGRQGTISGIRANFGEGGPVKTTLRLVSYSWYYISSMSLTNYMCVCVDSDKPRVQVGFRYRSHSMHICIATVSIAI